MNKVTIAGTLPRDAEFKEIKSSYAKASADRQSTLLCNFTVLVETEQGPKEKRWIEKLYVPCKAWNKLAQSCGEMKEGSSVQVEGRLKYEQWDDKDGNKKSKWVVIATEVVTMSSPTASSGSAVQQETTLNNIPELNITTAENKAALKFTFSDDDLPF